MDIRRIDIGKRTAHRPNQLGRVDLNGGKHANDQTNQHCAAQNVPPRIMHFFGERRNGVKADIGEHRDRCPLRKILPIKMRRIVERPQPIHRRLQ